MNDEIQTAVAVLKRGGVIAHATDTCYGFACDIFNEGALRRLYELKQMSLDKPVSILVASIKEAGEYAEFNEQAHVLAQQYWPGPLTLILPRKKKLPVFLNSGTKTIGIRVPNHTVSRELTKLLGRPITTTSANITTLPSPYSVSAIRKQFAGQSLKPDFILDAGLLSRTNLPSTIIDLTGAKPKIVRQGSLSVPLCE